MSFVENMTPIIVIVILISIVILTIYSFNSATTIKGNLDLMWSEQGFSVEREDTLFGPEIFARRNKNSIKYIGTNWVVSFHTLTLHYWACGIVLNKDIPEFSIRKGNPIPIVDRNRLKFSDKSLDKTLIVKTISPKWFLSKFSEESLILLQESLPEHTNICYLKKWFPGRYKPGDMKENSECSAIILKRQEMMDKSKVLDKVVKTAEIIAGILCNNEKEIR
ncbi:hypothetical protein KAU32_07520 [bacterium]|nr:hypothetical protein [bacterium]